MKIYKKLHDSKEVANIHIEKIKKSGGKVKQSMENGKILLEYYFEDDKSDVPSIIPNNKTVTFKDKVYFSEREYADSGIIKGYDARSKMYTISTKHGNCRLNYSDLKL